MRLEKYGRADEPLYGLLVFNEETMKMNLGRVFTDGEARMFFRAVLETNESEPSLGFYKVYIDHDGRETYVGMGAVTRNDEYDAAEIEYMLLPQYWHRGYGTELAGRLVRLASDTGVFSRIVAITDPSNRVSRKILDRHGFRFVKRYVNGDGEPAELYLREL